MKKSVVEEIYFLFWKINFDSAEKFQSIFARRNKRIGLKYPDLLRYSNY